MRLDLVVPNEGPYALEAVKAAAQFEAMGYDGLWFTDHVVGFEIFKPVYGAYWLEVLNALTYAAAVTKRVRLGIGVLVIPYRDAVYTAKALSTIDNLSNGRLDLGVGTGWARAEFFALGRQAYFEARGPYTDEALDIMQHCWQADGEIAYEGKFVSFRKVQFEPRPVQKPRIPFWIGSRGTAPAPLRRAVKYADVWHPTSMEPAELKSASAQLNELAGRKIPASVRTQLPLDQGVSAVVDKLAAYRDVGCVQVAMDFKAKSFKDFADGAQNVIAAAKKLQG